MTRLQELLGYLATGFLLAVFAGLLFRSLYRRWWTFAAFVGAVAIYSLGIIAWPSKFYEQSLWTAQETVLNLLRLAAACEVGLRVFRPFPGALRTLRTVVLIVLTVTLATIAAVTPDVLDYTTFLGKIQPRVLNGAVWLFTAVAGLILWYRLPVNHFQKAIVLSYVPYLLLFTILLDRLVAAGSDGTQWKGQWVIYANQIAFLALLAYWTLVTWRRERGGGDRPLEAHSLSGIS
jgi:hypothetical protein